MVPGTPAPEGAADEARPRVRTYHARRGRLSAAHHTALATLSRRWSLQPTGPLIDAAAVFGRAAPLVLDIGCGRGDSTRVQALAEPETDVIALDVHTRGIATLLRGIDSDDLQNVRVVLGDAVGFVEQRVADASVSGARIYFPDPWPKVRHSKRRLVQPPFVALLAARLRPGAFLHLATDDMAYAAQMHEVLEAAASFDLADRLPDDVRRPVTKYERRARRLGHQVVDLWATRTLSP
jgi:tRNA (guanine-N7-)-methyltransferase